MAEYHSLQEEAFEDLPDVPEKDKKEIEARAIMDADAYLQQLQKENPDQAAVTGFKEDVFLGKILLFDSERVSQGRQSLNDSERVVYANAFRRQFAKGPGETRIN